MSPALRLVGLPAQQSRQRIEAGDPMVMQFDGEAADARSKVKLQLEYDPQGFVKKVGDALGGTGRPDSFSAFPSGFPVCWDSASKTIF